MIYPFVDLRTIGWIVGLLLIVTHALALLHGAGVRALLQSFPRSRVAGVALLGVDALWAFLMMLNMDLGEFSGFRNGLLLLIPIAAVLTITYVDEFLAVRALGILLLLVAEPVLEAAFLRPEMSRLLLVVLAYAWVVFGMFYVGSPYLLRDHLAWLQKTEGRWKAAAGGGLVYGAAVLIFALTQYR